jgi:hypothetical protein
MPFETRDLAEYKAFDSFVPLYPYAMDYLAEKIEDKRAYIPARWVLFSLARNADSHGLTFVQARKLAALSQYAVGTVERCLDLLYELDFVRGHEYEQPLTGELRFEHQINPDVLWIAPDRIRQSLELWKRSNVKWILMKDHYPPLTTLTNRPIHQPTDNQPPPPPNPKTDQTSHPDEINSEGRDLSDRDPDPRPARSARKPARSANRSEPSPSSAPPPPGVRPALADCEAEFDDPARERLAQDIQMQIMCSLPEARQLIASYILPTAIGVWASFVQDMESGAIMRSRFAVLDYRLQRNAWSLDRLEEYQAKFARLTGDV